MFFRILQYLGLLIIILFSAMSVLLSTSERDIGTSNQGSFIYTYASFFEDRFFDLRMKMTLDQNVREPRIVLAAIDDHSLNKIGRWPWSRTKHAELVNKLYNFGAKILAFDVFYSEPELACNAESPDKVFINSIINFQSKPGNKVILPYAVDARLTQEIDEENYFKEAPDQLLNFMVDTKQAPGAKLRENIVSRKVYPIADLANADVGISHIEANADSDGVFRHYPLVTNVDSIYFPSFALMAYQYFTNDKPVLEIPSTESAFLNTKNGTAYVNYQGEAKVRWFGSAANFPVVPIYDIMMAKDNDTEIKLSL